MALITKAPRGTQDFTPDQSARMRYIEDTVMYIDRQPKPVSMTTTQTSRTSGDIRPHR